MLYMRKETWYAENVPAFTSHSLILVSNPLESYVIHRVPLRSRLTLSAAPLWPHKQYLRDTLRHEEDVYILYIHV